MVAYHFDQRFVTPCQQGWKSQTLRKNGRHKPSWGQMIQFSTGTRPKTYRKFMPDAMCIGAQKCRLCFLRDGEIDEIVVEDARLRNLDAFAVKEGFSDADDMSRFWRGTYGLSRAFDGFLIKWTPPQDLAWLPDFEPRFARQGALA